MHLGKKITQCPLAKHEKSLPGKKQPFGEWPVDLKSITRIGLDVNNPRKPTVWVIYLFSKRKNARLVGERLETIWFYETEAEQLSAIKKILSYHKHIKI